MFRPASLILAALALGVSAPAALAQHGRPPKPQQEQHNQPAQGFTSSERELISAYFSKHAEDVTPLPPGIAKNLARGKPLPPGIAKRQLPAALKRELPQREGLEVTIFGDRVVLLEASGVVVDILADIFK